MRSGSVWPSAFSTPTRICRSVSTGSIYQSINGSPTLRGVNYTPRTPEDSEQQWRSATDKLLLTPEEAAEQLGLSRSTIYELLRKGDLKSISIGRSRRIPTAALRTFISELQERS